MSAEQRAQGRGWVRIPASRAEQPAGPRAATARAAPPRTASPYAPPAHAAPDQPTIYLSLVKRWQEAGRTLPGHPDEEWERLISQPCWPGR
ncbi:MULTISPECIES: hypothetical protein [unclassified Streptomyces]|uniref:hypothetical protein n=1 Tax=unclassified Streptomyces TaxID=2593676 RepID=UPI00225A36E0|nr:MULTISPECIES: hypothetical protein [unclassified Streptomyces]MCX5147263.1 hypothetical protein [Streptomyces sp. NBC_00320]WSN50401.1 hypothetical protein OG299_23310 [Streptomyces sp. NBC_01296]WSW60161.1 hypothetical protein OG513_17115 [Streptomyces sp. NBC_00998]